MVSKLVCQVNNVTDIARIIAWSKVGITSKIKYLRERVSPLEQLCVHLLEPFIWIRACLDDK